MPSPCRWPIGPAAGLELIDAPAPAAVARRLSPAARACAATSWPSSAALDEARAEFERAAGLTRNTGARAPARAGEPTLRKIGVNLVELLVCSDRGRGVACGKHLSEGQVSTEEREFGLRPALHLSVFQRRLSPRSFEDFDLSALASSCSYIAAKGSTGSDSEPCLPRCCRYPHSPRPPPAWVAELHQRKP